MNAVELDPGAVGTVGVCSVADVRVAHRKMLLSLVDQAGGQAVAGATPKVQAFPGDSGAAVLLSLRDHAADPATDARMAAHLSAAVVAIAKQASALLAEGHVPCVLIGMYRVSGEPPDVADQQVRFYDSAGNLTREYPVGEQP